MSIRKNSKENEMETKMNQEIHMALKQFEDRYFIDGILNKQRVIQDLYHYDSELIAVMQHIKNQEDYRE